MLENRTDYADFFLITWLLHDYGVSGYYSNYEDELQISAFSSSPNENDIECGREASSFIRSSMSRFLFSVT